MPYSLTSAAATSSWVESGLDAQHSTSAPPALSARSRLAVSVVIWRQALRRWPAAACSLAKRSRMPPQHRHLLVGPFDPAPPGVGESEVAQRHSCWARRCATRRRGRLRLLAALHLKPLRLNSAYASVPGAGVIAGRALSGRCAEGVAQRVDHIGLLPGKEPVMRHAAEMAIGGGGLVNRPLQVERLDDSGGPEIEQLAQRRRQLLCRAPRPCRKCRSESKPARPRRSRTPPGFRTCAQGPPRPRSWPRSAPCSRPSDRPCSDPCPRTRRRHDVHSRRRYRR